MKKKIAALLRKWANKLNPQVITCHGEDPRECSYIPIKSVYKITPVQCGYIFPHKFGEIVDPDNIPQCQKEWAYRHIAEEFAKHFLESNIITFNIRKAYNNEVMLEGEMYVGVKQDRQ